VLRSGPVDHVERTEFFQKADPPRLLAHQFHRAVQPLQGCVVGTESEAAAQEKLSEVSDVRDYCKHLTASDTVILLGLGQKT
jgi:hypothetical protein